MLAQGVKGISELREAAELYYNGDEETAIVKGPLLGMIDFRRRKVLIKLVTEGTSRLIKGMALYSCVTCKRQARGMA